MSRDGAIIGVSDHNGWAVLITVAGDGTLLDRRRVELVDEGLPKHPHHHEGQTLPLEEALDLVDRLLIGRGADVNETDKNGVTPLHRVVRFRSPAGVKVLLENGADVNAVDRKTRSTPLHRAVTNTGARDGGQVKQVTEIILLLIAHGANPAIKNRAGKTARDYVRTPELVPLLSGA